MKKARYRIAIISIALGTPLLGTLVFMALFGLASQDLSILSFDSLQSLVFYGYLFGLLPTLFVVNYIDRTVKKNAQFHFLTALSYALFITFLPVVIIEALSEVDTSEVRSTWREPFGLIVLTIVFQAITLSIVMYLTKKLFRWAQVPFDIPPPMVNTP